MKKYRRMTWTDRLKIEALYNSGHSFRFISRSVGFSVSSVHSEVQHGLYSHLGAETSKRPIRYSAQIAHEYSQRQATAKGQPIKLGHHYDFARLVLEKVSLGLSLDSITGSLRKNGCWTVSTSTLYRYVDRGYIPGVTNANLPEKRRKRPYKHIRRAARPPKGMSIERRPQSINSRSTFGHWELDSVIGKSKGQRQSVLVLTERLTRFEIIIKVASKTSAATVRALNKIVPQFPKGTFKTITVDNGAEFHDCQGMEKSGLTVYYCHPFTSCERGSNERANRIIRRFFPKGRSLYATTQLECDDVSRWMNAMPRKILNYDSASICFIRQIAQLDPSFDCSKFRFCSDGLDN